MSEWRTVRVMDVLEYREGPGILAKDFRPTGVPLLRLAGLKRGAALLDGCNYLDPNMVDTRWQQFRLREGDVLLSTSASLGEVAVVDASGVGAVPYTGIIGFRPSSPDISRGFIPIALTGPSFKQQIVEMGVGSVMKHFGPSHLRTMTLVLPPVAVQEAIAEVLGALDDKIAVNQQVRVLTSGLLQAIFQSIVPVDVVRLPLADLAVATKGVSYRSVDLGYSHTALVTLKSVTRVGDYSSRGLKAYSGPYKPVQCVEPGEIVVALTDLTQNAEVVGRAVRVPASRDYETLVASLDLAIMRPKSRVSRELLLGILRSPAFRQHCRDRTSGTTVLHLASGALTTFLAPTLSPQLQQRYDNLAGPLLNREDATRLEEEQLAEMRDALLPQLMSGKIRVKDAERAVSEVV